MESCRIFSAFSAAAVSDSPPQPEVNSFLMLPLDAAPGWKAEAGKVRGGSVFLEGVELPSNGALPMQGKTRI